MPEDSILASLHKQAAKGEKMFNKKAQRIVVAIIAIILAITMVLTLIAPMM